MKTPVYIFIFLLVALLFPVQAQSQTQAPATTYNGLINIKQNKAEVEGDLEAGYGYFAERPVCRTLSDIDTDSRFAQGQLPASFVTHPYQRSK